MKPYPLFDPSEIPPHRNPSSIVIIITECHDYSLISYCLIISASLLPSDLKSNSAALIT